MKGRSHDDRQAGRTPPDQKHRKQMRQSVNGACHCSIGPGVRVGKQPKSQEHRHHPERRDRGVERRVEGHAQGLAELAESVAGEIHHHRPGGQHVKQPAHDPEQGIGEKKKQIAPGERFRGSWIGEALLQLEIAVGERRHVRAVGRVQERAAAARGDLLRAVAGLVAPVVVQVPGQEHRDFALEDLVLEEREVVLVVVRIVLPVNLRVDPVRLGIAEDHPVLRGHRLGHQFEIFDLTVVEVRIQLHVGAEQPPAARKLCREIAAGLLGLPSGEPFPSAEQPREGH